VSIADRIIVILLVLLAAPGLVRVLADWPPGTPSHSLSAEISGEDAAPGTARVSTTTSFGDLSLSFALRYDDALSLSRFALRSPVVSVGFLGPGDLPHLLCSPGGSWNRALPGSLVKIAEATGGAVMPEKYGFLICPIPERISIFSFFEPGFSLLGAHTLIDGGRLSLELMTTIAQSKPAPPPGLWLIERKPPPAGALCHGLLRVCLGLPFLTLSGGVVLSAARLSSLQMAASFTLEVELRRLEFIATLSGGTRGYFGFDRKIAAPPLECSWRLSTGKLLPIILFLRHEVDIETLPLIGIPFRATGETLSAGFEFDIWRISAKGSGGLGIETDRTGWQVFSSKAGIDMRLDFEHGHAGLAGKVSQKHDSPVVWSIRMPMEAEIGVFTLGMDPEVSAGETYRYDLSITLRGEVGRDAHWYISAGAGLSTQKPPVVDPRYRIGWKAKG
jgi:hypothetical protein